MPSPDSTFLLLLFQTKLQPIVVIFGKYLRTIHRLVFAVRVNMLHTCMETSRIATFVYEKTTINYTYEN